MIQMILWWTYNGIWNYNLPLFNKAVRRDRRGFMIVVNSVIKDVNIVSILGDKWEWL